LQNLRGVHLVVLSACETALGGTDPKSGIEIAGISSFFLEDKAKAVIASLWTVNDASTSLLMQQFYKNLATGKMTKAEALRQAQLSVLKGNVTAKDAPRRSGETDINVTVTSGDRAPSPANFSQPYYWAPFILIGNSL
jgi:CHAT domain-containing protein